MNETSLKFKAHEGSTIMEYWFNIWILREAR